MSDDVRAKYPAACAFHPLTRVVLAADFEAVQAERDALRASEARAMEVLEPRALVRRFHQTYEKFAPTFGYLTRPETRRLEMDSPNGLLMLAVCEEIFRAAFTHAPDRAAVQPSASPAGGVPGFKITLTCAHLDEHGVNDPCWTAMVDRFPHVRGYADGPVEAVRLAAEAAAELWFNDEHRPADQTTEG